MSAGFSNKGVAGNLDKTSYSWNSGSKTQTALSKRINGRRASIVYYVVISL